MNPSLTATYPFPFASHFLRLEPWGQYAFFRSFVTVPFLAQDPKAIDVVQFILEQCLLRREKNMKDKDGKPIVDLPLKMVRILKRYRR